MSGTVSIDKAGRLVVPKPIREQLHLRPGDLLDIEQREDAIVMRPLRRAPMMAKEQGVWVFDAGGPSDQSIPDLVDDMREDRINDLSTRDMSGA